MTTPPDLSNITAAGLAAFVQLAGPIVRIVEGKGTIADDETAVNIVMNAVALFDPAAIPIIDLIEDAEPFIAAYLQYGKVIGISGGIPPSFPPGGGPTPFEPR